MSGVYGCCVASDVSREGWPAGGHVMQAALSWGCFPKFSHATVFGYEWLHMQSWLPLLVINLCLCSRGPHGQLHPWEYVQINGFSVLMAQILFHKVIGASIWWENCSFLFYIRCCKGKGKFHIFLVCSSVDFCLFVACVSYVIFFSNSLLSYWEHICLKWFCQGKLCITTYQ